MKAALEAWGASSNLFHQGFAKEVADAKTVAATLANPGVCSNVPSAQIGPFDEESEVPTDLDLRSDQQGQKRPRLQGPRARYSRGEGRR